MIIDYVLIRETLYIVAACPVKSISRANLQTALLLGHSGFDCRKAYVRDIPVEIPAKHLKPPVRIAVGTIDIDAVAQGVKDVPIDAVVRVSIVFNPDARGGGGHWQACAMEPVPLHLVAATGVQIQAGVGRAGRAALQIEIVTGHRGEIRTVDFHACHIVEKSGTVHHHGARVSVGVGLHSCGESRELATNGIGLRALAAVVILDIAMAVHFKTRVFGVDGMAAVSRHGGRVLETAPFELHPTDLPHRDMVDKRRAVLHEIVVVIHGKDASSETAQVVRDRSVRMRVFVGKESHGASVVDEIRAVGQDDAAGGGIRPTVVIPGMYPTVRILNGGPVAQLHGTLVLRQLPFGPVAQHLDALPHLVGASRG